MTLHPRPRAAFTLVEILVILTIIALLAALTTSAVFRLQDSSRETNTNTHLQKIHMELEKQWNAKVALIKTEANIPAAVVELTKDQNGNPDLLRAKALHMKLRLRQEFPQHFSELNPPPAPLATSYPVKASFRTALRNPVATETTAEAQSAALLMLILSQGSGGSTTDVDNIARTKLMDFPQANNAPPVQLKVFSDEWGKHIAFRRWLDDDMTDVQRELNNPPFVSAAQVQSGKMDPQDPDGRLKMPEQHWFTPQNGPNYRRQSLSVLARTDPQARPFIQDPFNGWNRGPFVFSAGKNGLFRFKDPNNTMPPDDPRLPAETDLDNLYSYRIAGAGKGN